MLSLFQNLSLLVRIHLNRKQISQWDFTLFSRVQKFHKKEKRRGIMALMRRSKRSQKSLLPTRFTQPILFSRLVIPLTRISHQCIFSSELTLLGNPFFSRTVKVSIEFWSGGRLSKLVAFLASLRWYLVLSQSKDCSRRKQFSSSSMITLSWNLWKNDRC